MGHPSVSVRSPWPCAPVSCVVRLGTTASGIDTEPRIVHCRASNDGQELGDWFKTSRIVDMFLDEAPEKDARRVTDFAAGMVYVAGGTCRRLQPSDSALLTRRRGAPAGRFWRD